MTASDQALIHLETQVAGQYLSQGAVSAGLLADLYQLRQELGKYWDVGSQRFRRLEDG
jgi:hypothetical protein